MPRPMTGSDQANQNAHETMRRRRAALRRMVLAAYGVQGKTNADWLWQLENEGFEIGEQTLMTDMKAIGAARVRRTINGRTGSYTVLQGYVPPNSPESLPRELYPQEQLESECYRMIVRFVEDVELTGNRVVLKCSIYMGQRIGFHINTLDWHEIQFVHPSLHVVEVVCRTEDAAEIVYERLWAGGYYIE